MLKKEVLIAVMVFLILFPALLKGLKTPIITGKKILYAHYISFLFGSFCALHLYHFFNTKKYYLFSAIIIPYFIFTLFLKGSNYNWWMLNLPRFLIPLSSFWLNFSIRPIEERYLYVILSIGTVMAIAYSIGSHIMHARYGGVV